TRFRTSLNSGLRCPTAGRPITSRTTSGKGVGPGIINNCVCFTTRYLLPNTCSKNFTHPRQSAMAFGFYMDKPDPIIKQPTPERYESPQILPGTPGFLPSATDGTPDMKAIFSRQSAERRFTPPPVKGSASAVSTRNPRLYFAARETDRLEKSGES